MLAQLFLRKRFTPTGVGTTRAHYEDKPMSTVHPHGCGDNNKIAQRLKPMGGSPPRVWGQLFGRARRR